MERQLISITELSQWLKLAKGTIYNMCCKRRLPFVKIGRCLRFDPAAIAEYIKARTNPEGRNGHQR